MTAVRSALLRLVLPAVFVSGCNLEIVDSSSSGYRRLDQPDGWLHETRSAEPELKDPAACAPVEDIDRWRELLVVDRSVLSDRRARNDEGGVWSFRRMLEALAGEGASGAALAYAWLDQWSTVTAVGPDRAPVAPRPAMESVLAGPWREAGGTLASAPFRLIAIVNRPDLRADEGGCGAGGELRFVYTALDPRTERALPMTVNVEIPYPSTRSARGWITAWRALSRHALGDGYAEALAQLTEEVLAAAPKETWRVRTNEGVLAEPWELREFTLSSAGGAAPRLTQVPLATTPRIELDGAASLASWATESASRIDAGTHVLPAAFQAGSAILATPSFRWSGGSPAMRSLGKQTCNGCHGGDRGESSPPFQHLAAPDASLEGYYGPSPDGETRISRWLHDPEGGEDELTRRARSASAALCASTCREPSY